MMELLFLLAIFNANLTPANAIPEITALEGFTRWSLKLLCVVDGSQPEGILVGKVVTRPTRTVALDERCCAEVLEARTWRCKRLTSTFCSRRSVLKFPSKED